MLDRSGPGWRTRQSCDTELTKAANWLWERSSELGCTAPMLSDHGIRAEGLVKTFGRTRALDHLDLEVPREAW